MKLLLNRESPWQRIASNDPAATETAAEPSIVTFEFEALTDYWAKWKERIVRWGLPAFATVEVTSEERSRSDVEWPIDVIDSKVKDADGTVIESRVTVLYFMLEWCTALVFRGRPDQILGARDRALEVMRSGHPEWSTGEPVAIAQLYGD